MAVRRVCTIAALALLGATATPRSARAQDVLYGLMGGGPAYPVGPLAHQLTSVGYDVIAGARIRRLLSHLGLRVVGTFNEFPADRPASGYLRLAALITSVTAGFDVWAVRPYAFLGGGYYYYASTIHLTVPPVGFETPPPPHTLPPRGYASAFGLDGGVGLRVPVHRFSVVVEGREDYVFLGRRDAAIIPLTVGLAYSYSLGL